MKKLLKFSLFALASVLMLGSCEPKEAIIDRQTEVIFTLDNITSSKKDDNAILCSDEPAMYVEVSIDGTDYVLDILPNLDGGKQTEVLKLDAGMYDITSFEVYSATGTLIYAAPLSGSVYSNQFNIPGLPQQFEVKAFEKHKEVVDVICFQPSTYTNFGFEWFQYRESKIKQLYFFGDICTANYVEWHQELEGNPYLNQQYDGYDFPAIFKVVLKDAQGIIVSESDNLSTQGVGSPLLVEYLDLVAVDEYFTAEIHLYLPDGTTTLIHTELFNDDDILGGDDGVFDFVIGNCSYVEPDVEISPLKLIPFGGEMMITTDAADSAYVNIQFKDLVNTAFLVEEQVKYGSWCVAKNLFITANVWYEFKFYTSLDIEAMPTARLQSINWEAINYIINNAEELVAQYGVTAVQDGIWYFTDDISINAVSTLALGESYVPQPGDLVAVLAVPNEQDGTRAQIMSVRLRV